MTTKLKRSQKLLVKIPSTKGIMTFRPLRKLTEGYRTIQMNDGKTYDRLGLTVYSKDGKEVHLGLEVLPNGWMNVYAISSLFEITRDDDLRGTFGTLTPISPQTKRGKGN